MRSEKLTWNQPWEMKNWYGTSKKRWEIYVGCWSTHSFHTSKTRSEGSHHTIRDHQWLKCSVPICAFCITFPFCDQTIGWHNKSPLSSQASVIQFQLTASEARLAAVEECDCQRSCRVNGTIRQDGATWKSGCEICSCVVSSGQCLCYSPFIYPLTSTLLGILI